MHVLTTPAVMLKSAAPISDFVLMHAFHTHVSKHCHRTVCNVS